MMYKYLIAFLVLLSLQKVISSDTKLNIEILYESLCPDSLRFIKHQLYPVWNELAPYVNLKLIPFGKSASTDNGTKFICQHGPLECKGNRIQSCALDITNNQSTQVEYVNCFMKLFSKEARNNEQYGQSCAEATGLKFNEILECYRSEEGTKLQLIAEKDTFKYTPTFIPTIVYNGIFNQELQDASFNDFRKVVCGFITQIHPEACKQRTVLRL